MNCSTHIAELFSPPRITEYAADYGLEPGFAIDLETWRRNGEPWDLTQPHAVKEMWALVKEQEALLVTGGPPCQMFSTLQRLAKTLPDIWNKRREEAEDLLKVAFRVYAHKYRNDKYFLHEHPKLADSWCLPFVDRLARRPGVYKVSGPMCRRNMIGQDD